MSVLFKTEELTKVMYHADNDVHSRLTPVRRTNINFFYDYEKMPLGEEIGLLEPFQDRDDVYNELRGILIKPLLTGYLTLKHCLDLALELTLLAINILAYSPKKISESVTNVLVETLYVAGYLSSHIITDITVVPVFLIRCLATLGNACIQFATPTQKYAPVYENYKSSQEPGKSATAPLVQATLVDANELYTDSSTLTSHI